MYRQVSTTWKAPNGRILTPGVEVTIRGERGRFRFRQHVTTEAGVEYVDLMGPRGFRSFYPDRIKTVHTQRKLRPVSGKALVSVVAA